MANSTQAQSVTVAAHNVPLNSEKNISFFAADEVASTSADHSGDLEDSFEDEPQEPLDIVGALNTLNLDAELGESLPEKQDPPRRNGAGGKETRAFSGVNDANYASPRPPQGFVAQTSLTPNPGPVAGFRQAPNSLANGASTPSYGWGNNFLPFSAPPIAYPVTDPHMTAEMALQIPPFRLPDESIAGGSPLAFSSQKGHSASNALHLLHAFGGILDSRFAYEGFGSANTNPEAFVPTPFAGMEKQHNNGPDIGAVSLGKSFTDGDAAFDKGTSGVGQTNVGSNLWNLNPAHPTHPSHPANAMPQFVHLPHAEAYLGNQYGHYGHGPIPGQLNALKQSPVHAQGQPLGHTSTRFFQEDSSSFKGQRSNHGDGHNGHRRQHYMNGGVNVHRKMHNSSRRKGDDASKYANAKLEDFSGNIFSLCKDQHGCRFLQRQLDTSSDAHLGLRGLSKDVAATMIFNELYLKIVELMVDPFGNYLVQKLFENVSTDQRLVLVKNAAPEFVNVALDPHGTRALQKLVECISTPEEARILIESLSPHVVSLSRDLNGNHVVQKCLQKLKPQDNQFIFDIASVHCEQIATHRHGCCVLQRCLDHGTEAQRAQLSLKVAQISNKLSSDPFGNYVVQYVLTRGDEASVAMILDHILAQIVPLSLHKFGSNVIEKSLRISHLTDSVIAALLKKLDLFSIMLHDPYGNYVLQTSLDVANPEDLAKLASSLPLHLPSIKNTPHGRRILTKIQNIM